MALPFSPRFVTFAVAVLSCAYCLGQTPQQTPVPAPMNGAGIAADGGQEPTQPLPGSISGTVVDQSGAVVAGALVKLTGKGPLTSQEALSAKDGQFSFTNIAAGQFQVTITAAGFATRMTSGILQPGQNYIVLGAALEVAAAETEVDVGIPRTEIAEEQIKIEEQQRVLGILPNFYVSYIPNAVPLTAKQKFKLAGKTVVDPFTFLFVAGGAGIQQAQNHFEGYGQGIEGYGKRFGAGYADTVAGTFIGGAILPSIFRQDPRYFYKGTGTKTSRALYAIANAFICKGDNGRWQVNYSNILGNLAAGGISNLYYPAQDRDGAQLTLENGAIGIGTTAVANLFQEFVIRKLTPKAPKNEPAKP
jgi:hypothetical protein